MGSLVYDIGTAVLGAAAAAGIAFLIVYSLLARWWQSREGWYLAASSAGFALILSYNFAAVMRWFDSGPRPSPNLTEAQEWTRLVVYALVLLIMLWRGLLLLLAQYELWRAKVADRDDTADYRNGYPPKP